jgi:hypothetical protein
MWPYLLKIYDRIRAARGLRRCPLPEYAFEYTFDEYAFDASKNVNAFTLLN